MSLVLHTTSCNLAHQQAHQTRAGSQGAEGDVVVLQLPLFQQALEGLGRLEQVRGVGDRAEALWVGSYQPEGFWAMFSWCLIIRGVS